MKFDKDKVFSAIYADDVPVGTRGCFANNLVDLKDAVENEEILTVEKIYGENTSYRFKASDDFEYCFFYFVEEPEEDTYRPYKNIDEMIEDFGKRGNDWRYAPRPLIWVKEKDNGSEYLITGFCTDNSVIIDNISIDFSDLFEDYTYLDGTPCGKKL